jgi:hypothetical protein
MITNKLTGGFGARRNGGQVRRAPDLRNYLHFMWLKPISLNFLLSVH